MRRVHVVVSGRVQGVAYRYSAQSAARRHQITGWVRNLRDGSVEAEIQGSKEAVEAMLDWLHEGPPPARVSHIQATDRPASPDETGFRILTGW